MKINKAILGAAILALTVFASAEERVEGRDQRQHQRIREGVRSGELTLDEAKDLRGDQRKIHRTERRAGRDGQVTDREQKRLDRMHRKESRKIYREKHDGEKRGE